MEKIKNNLSNQQFRYLGYTAIAVSTFIFILTFQNCSQNDNSKPIDKFSVPTTTSSTTSSTTTTTPSTGDKAVFKLSEKYGEDDNISEILWEISSRACGKDEIGVETGLSLEIPWNDPTASYGGATIITPLIQFEQEECFIYHRFGFDSVSLDRLSCVRPSGFLSFSLSSDSSIKKDHFAAGSSIILEFNKFKNVKESLKDKTFQWSIKKVGDDTELADQSHTSTQLTYTFSEIGLYNISIKEISKDNPSGFPFSDNKELFIGLCEEEVEAVEVVLSKESFGELTPKSILDTEHSIFNYVRPSDTDTNNKVTLIFNHTRGRYPPHIYKYKRSSTSKFIDIDIQNADKCFLDTEPIETCFTTLIGCPSEQPNCNTIRCTHETRREDLPSLSSCSGNALDMSTLDTDKTQCTDTVFVVAATKEDITYKRQRAFYKHCPAGEDYCYFGDESIRPDDHKCPSS